MLHSLPPLEPHGGEPTGGPAAPVALAGLPLLRSGLLSLLLLPARPPPIAMDIACCERRMSVVAVVAAAVAVAGELSLVGVGE